MQHCIMGFTVCSPHVKIFNLIVDGSSYSRAQSLETGSERNEWENIQRALTRGWRGSGRDVVDRLATEERWAGLLSEHTRQAASLALSSVRALRPSGRAAANK